MPQIIVLYLKKTGELTKSLLFFAGLMMLLPKLSTRQSVRAVCVTILIVGAFHLSCNVSEIYAVPEIHESEKVLDVDDSEVVPVIAIEGKIKENAKASEWAPLSEPTEETATVSVETVAVGSESDAHSLAFAYTFIFSSKAGTTSESSTSKTFSNSCVSGAA